MGKSFLTKSVFKSGNNLDMSALEDMIAVLTGDVNSKIDVDYVMTKCDVFNAAIKDYLKIRFQLGKTILSCYEEAGSRSINDNNKIIKPIKEYLNNIKKYRDEVVDILNQKEDSISKFKKEYFEFKNSQIIIDAMMICNNLTDIDFEKPYSNEDIYVFKNIKDYENERLNFKFILMDQEISEELRLSLFQSLKELHGVTSAIHTIYNEPNIDPEQIYPMLMNLMDELLADVKGCKAARNVLRKSSTLFKENFTRYYKNFKVTESPFGIIEDFMSDVLSDAKSNLSNAKVITELSTIISTIRKKIAKKGVKNPTFDKVMDFADNVIHKYTSGEDVNPDSIKDDLNTIMSFTKNMTGEGNNNNS